MNILKYFRPIKQTPDLPDPNGPLSENMPSSAVSSANAKVTDVFEKQTSSIRGPYLTLTPTQKYQIGKRTAEYGTTAAIRYYQKKFPDLPLKETTVRRLKNLYQSSLKAQGPEASSFEAVNEIHGSKTGRPLLIGDELDKQVQQYLTDLRKRGCVINTRIAIAVGEGILLNKDANLLASNGSGITLTKDWAKYVFKRMGLVKRKGNTKAKVSVEDFAEIKKLFHLDIKGIVGMDEVPSELIINWDQTGLNYVPVSSWTMAEEGSKRVKIDGKDDKRQITAVFACSMAGDFLPPQIIYQGKTTRCLPKFKFPSDWSIIYSANHWSNEGTMEEYILRIIFPYLSQMKEKLKLSSDYPALLLYDNFKGQCTEKLLKLLNANNISVVLIPPHCTDRLQPLDVSVNKAAKEFLRNSFQKWYASIVCSQLNGKTEKKAVDLRLSVMKPHGAKWLVELCEYLRNNPDIIINEFRETGILDCVDSVTSL